MQVAIFSALISAATALIVMFITHWISLCNEQIKFRRAKAQDLANILFKMLDEVYKLADADILTEDKHQANKIRHQSQLLSRHKGLIELEIILYFPDLKDKWINHSQNIEMLTKAIYNGAENMQDMYPNDLFKEILNSHDELVNAIPIKYPELTGKMFWKPRFLLSCLR
jgi:hypothetical protein